MPSLSRMFWRWRSTVLMLITSSWAISFEVYASAISFSTCNSRGVRMSNCSSSGRPRSTKSLTRVEPAAGERNDGPHLVRLLDAGRFWHGDIEDRKVNVLVERLLHRLGAVFGLRHDLHVRLGVDD